MAPRGRRSGYQNYSLHDQMLLCSIADKLEPIGRNMWEEVAVMYNAKRSRNSIDRDYDSLRRKFKTLYSRAKPTGSNGELPPKLKPVRYAQEIQVRIERKGGTITCHDGLDEGQDDGRLQEEVDEALGTADDEEEEEESEEEMDIEPDEAGGSTSPTQDGRGSMDQERPNRSEEEESSQVELDDVQLSAVGSVVTSRGVFDASLGADVYSSAAESDQDAGTEQEIVVEDLDEATENEFEIVNANNQARSIGVPTALAFSPCEANAQQAQITRVQLPTQSTGTSQTLADRGASPSSPMTAGVEDSTGGTPKTLVPMLRHGLRPINPRPDKSPAQTLRFPRSGNATTSENQPPNPRLSNPMPSTGLSGDSAKSPVGQARGAAPAKSRVGRPKSSKRPARPTFSYPDGPVLSRDPANVARDAREAQKHDRLSVSSNRLGGCDLRVLRDTIDVRKPPSEDGNSKRSPSVNSGPGGNFMANKRQKSRSKLKELEGAMARVEEKQNNGTNEMMQLLVFMRQDTAERAALEEKRRRDEREERWAFEKADREERERVRREEARLKLEMARLERQDREMKEAAAVQESNRRYEERLERERADARERHEAMVLMFTALQQGQRGRPASSENTSTQSNEEL